MAEELYLCTLNIAKTVKDSAASEPTLHHMSCEVY